jgi:hypothetical protein
MENVVAPCLRCVGVVIFLVLGLFVVTGYAPKSSGWDRHLACRHVSRVLVSFCVLHGCIL